MPTIRNRFYPLRDVNEHDVIPFFSLNTNSGLAGQLVKIVTGAANPQNLDGWSNAGVGASYTNTVSYRYESKAKITPTASGDTRYSALGVTLNSTLETDENGLPLRYYPRRAKEINAVISGENVNVATRGLFGMWGNEIDQSLASPAPGNLVCISRSGEGRLAAVNPNVSSQFNLSGLSSNTPWVYTPQHVIGKWISSLPTATNTGLANEFSAQGGYALFQLSTLA